MQSNLTGNEPLNEIKTQLLTREGVYRLASQSEYGRPKCSPYTPQTNAPNTNNSSLPLVHISFSKFATNTTNYHNRTSTHIVHYPHQHRINSHDENETNNSRLTLSNEHKFNGNSNYSHETNAEDNDSDILCSFYQNNNVLHEEQIQERICFNIGRELFIFIFNGLQPSDPSKLVDRKTYKSTSPTCHDFCTNLEQRISLLLIGFSHGQIQLIDPYRTEINKFYNQERLIDKSKVTCIRWLPRSKSNFLVAYSSGQMYLYKEDLPCFTTTPTYQQFKIGDGFTIYTCKTKSTRNPLYRWSIGNNSNDNGLTTSLNNIQSTQSAINEFAFSPCGQYLAIVSQDGFLRVFNYDQMELIGLMRSYFGGLLCVGWSPDSKFLVTGGEDDLITVWSLQDRRVIARGQGHKSWINSVTFDPFMTKTKDDYQEDNYANLQNSDIDNDSMDETHNSNSNHTCKSRNNEFKLLTNYRIGSVGQDTQICLWDLTDDIIRQSSVIKSRSRSTITTTSIGTSSNNKDNNEYKTSKMFNNLITGNVTNSTGNQPLSTSNNFFSLKKSGHKKGFLSSRSFLDHGKGNKNMNSIPSVVNNKNDLSNYIPSFSNSVFTDNFFSNVCDSSRLLGTILCPRLKEVPMLEPHICKKISNERLTSLVFRKDYFVVANHDGKIIIFARPNKLNNKNLKISSPNASMASDVNDINNLSTIGGGDDEDESEPIMK